MSTVTIAANGDIQAAVNANPQGTTFQLADGVYRNQQFEPKTGDTFLGAADGGTILSGATLLTNWTRSGQYSVATGLPAPLVGQTVTESASLASDLNDLFINNALYTRVSSLSQVTAGTWYFDTTTNSVYLSDNPVGKTVEYSTTPFLMSDQGAAGVTFKNLTIEKYATDAQVGAVDGGVNYVFDNVTMTENHGAGLNIGAGSIVQGGTYSANGQIGIDGYLANGAKILNATITGNNYAGYDPDWDAGGIKLATSSNVTISGNIVSNNNAQGIWADIDSTNWTISNNTIANNKGAGIEYEISHGLTKISGNIVSGNTGAGIMIANSDGIAVTGNTVTVGAGNTGTSTSTADGGIDIINVSRGSGPDGLYQSVNDTVSNNLVIHPGDSASDGIYYYQPISGSANNTWTNNTYKVANGAGVYWYFGTSQYTWAALEQSEPFGNPGTMAVGVTAPQPTPTVTPAPTPAPTPTPISTNKLTVYISEDAYLGDAQFTVSVNGQQVGGTMTASALHGTDDSNVFTLTGNWAVKDVAIQFLNDAYGGPSVGDRNLYVDSIASNGTLYANTAAALYTAGTQDFALSTPSTSAPADNLTVHLSEDAYKGNANFIVTMDGRQITTAQAVTTLHSSGTWQDVTIAGAFGAGTHTIEVTFTNDLYAGSPSTDRNLYVNGIDVNGRHYGGGVSSLMSTGSTATFIVSTTR